MRSLVSAPGWNQNSFFRISQNLFWFHPGADTKDLIEIKRDLALLNKTLNLRLDSCRQDSHQSLGGKSVLGSLLVISLWPVCEHLVGSLVDVMDDLAKVGLEVLGGKTLKVGQSCWWNISLPLEVTLASVNETSERLILVHEVNKGCSKLQILGWDGAFATGREGDSRLLVSLNSLTGSSCSLSHVSSKDNDVEILVDVVHDLRLEESLGSIVHDLVAELGLSNVLSQLLDTSSTSLLSAVKINDLVSIVLGTLTIGHLGNKLLDNLKFSSEQSILGHVHLVSVSLQKAGIDSGNSLNKTFKGGRDLELLEEGCNNASSGGSGETDLVVDNDWSVDGGSNQGLADDVVVSLQGRGGVADRNSPVNKSWELLLKSLNNLAQALELLDLNLRLLLVDVNNLELSTVGALSSLALTKEGSLLSLDDVSGDGSKLGIFTNLVGRTSTDGVSVDINCGFLSQVEPDDGSILGIDGSTNLLKSLLEPINGGLTTAVDLESWNSAEVWKSGNWIGELLNFVEMVGHTDRLLHVPHGGV